METPQAGMPRLWMEQVIRGPRAVHPRSEWIEELDNERFMLDPLPIAPPPTDAQLDAEYRGDTPKSM